MKLFKKEPVYTLTIELGGETFKSESDNIQELLNISLPFIKSKATVTLSSEGKSRTEIILPFPMKRIMNNKLGKEILLTKMSKNLK